MLVALLFLYNIILQQIKTIRKAKKITIKVLRLMIYAEDFRIKTFQSVV